jgi:hypothetical protein
MSHLRVWGSATVVGLLTWSAGCSMMTGKLPLTTDRPPKQSEPDLGEDKWSHVGKEGRGHRPLDDERDPLKPLIMSEEARQIERNLGYK